MKSMGKSTIQQGIQKKKKSEPFKNFRDGIWVMGAPDSGQRKI